MSYQTKADKAFGHKLSDLLAPRGCYSINSQHEDVHFLKWSEGYNEGEVFRLFYQYGTYLELIGQDAPVGEPLVFEFPVKKDDADKTIDEMVEDAHVRMVEFGDQLMEQFTGSSDKNADS